jgi:hypothetical protein
MMKIGEKLETKSTGGNVPRQKSVVMRPGDHTAKQLHDAAIARTVKLHRPYEVIAGELAGIDEDDYAIVFTAPKGGDRSIVATRSQRGNAVKLRDLLSTAWAEGHWASGRE